ncbi:MAG: hypothetical protein QOG79_837 [Mycobacterium sp.]|nr:hypothetical protein [Mycobacterium sp.]
MPRRARRAVATPRPGGSTVLAQRREQWRGTDYEVRALVGSATKVYRCPGCDQEIRNVGHVVTWPSYDVDAVDRRHWHNVCWAARENRAPTIERGRSAPRH